MFNGTTGVVTGLSLEDHALTVRTGEDEEIGYDFDELDELAHAYAVTIHRSQGSEYPAVVIHLTTTQPDPPAPARASSRRYDQPRHS